MPHTCRGEHSIYRLEYRMTIPELAAKAAGHTEANPIILTPQEADDIAEAYTEACERCHVLTEELAARDEEMAAVRVQLHAALYPKAAA